MYYYCPIKNVIFIKGGDPNQAKAQEERMQAMEEAKHSILAQVLSQDARARCNYYVIISL